MCVDIGLREHATERFEHLLAAAHSDQPVVYQGNAHFGGRAGGEALERGDSYHGVVTNHRADGSPFKQRISIHPVRDKSGVVVQHVSICEEI